MIYILPLIAAIIGWFTNYLAVKMLFHPKQPKKFLLIKFHGVFPKRHHVIAEKLGEIVSKELFSIDDLAQSLNNEKNKTEILELVGSKIENVLKTKLVEKMPMLAMFINDEMVQKIKQPFLEEVEAFLPELIDKLKSSIDSDAIKNIVEEKVKAFSTDKLEEMLNSILKKEFKFIEIVGAVLGFIIGLVQLALALIQ